MVEALRAEFTSWAGDRLVLDTTTDLSANVATALGFLSASA
ncbi:hypothetical protein OG612_39920 [Streptomyces sp. NBC_01527]